MWPDLQFPADLVTFIEEILNGKLHFFCSVIVKDNWGFYDFMCILNRVLWQKIYISSVQLNRFSMKAFPNDFALSNIKDSLIHLKALILYWAGWHKIQPLEDV